MASPSPQPPVSYPQAPQVDPMIGSSIGGFKVVKQLGVGGMGTVYMGEHAIIGSKVAIKVLHPQLASSTDLVQRFFSEARAVNLIGHENIVNIIDLNMLPGNRYYYVMEYLEGQTLQALTVGPVPVAKAVPILSQVCEALQAAHRHGIVHRDLKPENIFLLRRGRVEHFVKVLDFGIAKLLDGHAGAQKTASGLIIGTPEFMAPEQASGLSVDARADIYALGVVSYLIVTGRLPFNYPNIAQLLIAHQQEVPVPPHKACSAVPEPVSEAIMKALAKKPEDRFQDANAFRDALEAALVEVSSPAAVVKPPAVEVSQPTPQPAESRHVAPFWARILKGGPPDRLRCHDLSRGGVFLCTEGAMPPPFTRLKLMLEAPGMELEISADVVRQVTAEQAKTWNMPAGFAVQFVDVGAQAKDSLMRLVKGLPLAPAEEPPLAGKPDPEAERVLNFYRKRIRGDHYVVLGIAQEVDLSDVRQRGREAKRELEVLKANRLTPEQRAQIDAAIERLDQAVVVLGSPKLRAEFDAGRNNFQGVAKCIAAGLTPMEMETLRRKFLQSNPKADSNGRIHYATALAWDAQSNSSSALLELEKALAMDPLNLDFHQRYWSIKRRQRTK